MENNQTNQNKQEQKGKKPYRKPHNRMAQKRQSDHLRDAVADDLTAQELARVQTPPVAPTQKQEQPVPTKKAKNSEVGAANTKGQAKPGTPPQGKREPAGRRTRQPARRQATELPKESAFFFDDDFSDFILSARNTRKKKESAFSTPTAQPEPPSPYPPGPEVLDDIPRISYAAVGGKKEPEQPLLCIVGVQFNAAGKIYYFDPGKETYNEGERVIVETTHGLEFGTIALENRMITQSDAIKALRPVIRRATAEDIQHDRENHVKEEEAFQICSQKIQAHGLEMKLVEAQYTFDNSKLLFYFTADGRVDFRELVKDLASVFRLRIELRQIGIRDESRMMGGLGACGRPLCCASFLNDFVQVSIKMAKEQNLSLNSGKISGCCGRLMCCLHYEYETYREEARLMPQIDSRVQTPDGIATVCEISPIPGTIKVRFDNADLPVKTFYKKDVSPLVPPPSAELPADNDKGELQIAE